MQPDHQELAGEIARQVLAGLVKLPADFFPSSLHGTHSMRFSLPWTGEAWGMGVLGEWKLDIRLSADQLVLLFIDPAYVTRAQFIFGREEALPSGQK